MDIYLVLIGLCFMTLNSAASSNQTDSTPLKENNRTSIKPTVSTPLKKNNRTSTKPTVSTPALNENNHTSSLNQTDYAAKKLYFTEADFRGPEENFPTSTNRSITDAQRKSLRRRVKYLKEKMQSELEQNNQTSVNHTFYNPLEERFRNSSEPVDLRKITAPHILHPPRSTLQGICASYVSKTGDTASGWPYNPKEFTAAHFYLPFNSVVMVSVGSKVVIAKINDRSPFWKGAMLDLSVAAGRALNMSLDSAYHCTMSLLSLGSGRTRTQDAYRRRVVG